MTDSVDYQTETVDFEITDELFREQQEDIEGLEPHQIAWLMAVESAWECDPMEFYPLEGTDE